MLRSVPPKTFGSEGYVYPVYGNIKYLKHAIASVTSLRRHDTHRPVALVCESQHREILERLQLTDLFDVITPISPDHCSIVGFKHNFSEYMLFDRTLFLDCDMIWCKSPDPLWISFSAYPFTITGQLTADSFFGGPKNFGVLRDTLFRRRRRTLKRFGLTYLSRVQSGMIFAQDYDLSSKVCKMASEMLSRKDETHFQSRTMEQGRTEESCEWSLAMAMSKLNLPVYPWLMGQESPQIDYIQDLTQHDADFEYVTCTFYNNPFVFSFRGLKSVSLRNTLLRIAKFIPGKADHMFVTPYVLHFGWLHQKQPFFEFSERVWNRLKKDKGFTKSDLDVLQIEKR
jgi:hypothetical protein